MHSTGKRKVFTKGLNAVMHHHHWGSDCLSAKPIKMMLTGCEVMTHEIGNFLTYV